MLEILNLDSLEERARQALDPMLFDYIAGGAADEWTLGENRAAWSRIQLLPRMLRGVETRVLETHILGTPVSMPVVVAPMACHGLCNTEAESATARATAAAGTIFTASTMSNCSLETIAAASGAAPRWFQLYVYRDHGLTKSLVDRALAAGYSALCVTVDTPLAGQRERDLRNRLRMPSHLRLDNFPDAHTQVNQSAVDRGSSLAHYIAAQWDPSLRWTDIEWLRSLSPLPVLVKGVLAPDDARLAAEHGASAVVVSNHGGRQLDGVPAAVTMLPAIRDAVAGRLEILVDGGVRRGSDVLKAVALGARAVMLGRPVLWGLTLDGADGVRAVLEHIRRELDLAMALAGVANVAEVDGGLVL